MSSYSYPTVLPSDSEAEDTVPLTSAFATTIRSISSTANTQGQQWLPASDSKVSSPALPGPIRRRRKIRQLQPYEPALIGKAYRYPGGKKIYMCVARKKVRTPPSIPVVPESAVLPPPTIFYRQITTVLIPSTTPPPVSSPATTHSKPVSPQQRTRK